MIALATRVDVQEAAERSVALPPVLSGSAIMTTDKIARAIACVSPA